MPVKGILDPVAVDIFVKYYKVPYNYNGWLEGQYKPPEELLHRGMNCETLVHEYVNELIKRTTGKAIRLPSHLRAAEMWLENPYLRKVSFGEQKLIGDVFFFGLEKPLKEDKAVNPTNFYDLHLAGYVGSTSDHEPLLLHTSIGDEGIFISTIKDVQDPSKHGNRHALFYGVKRSNELEYAYADQYV